MRYTKQELIDAYLADLETDIRCAERDGHAEYAEKCRAERDALLKANHILIDRYGMPKPENH